MRPGTTGALLYGIGAIPAIGLGSAIFISGHTVGLVLLAVALWREHVVLAWAAVLLGASQILHFVFAVIAQVPALDGCAWALTASGFAVRTGPPEPDQARSVLVASAQQARQARHPAPVTTTDPRERGGTTC